MFFILCCFFSYLWYNQIMKKNHMSIFSFTLLFGYGVIIALNMALDFSVQMFLNLMLCLSVILLPAALFMFLGRLLPKSFFDADKKWFKVTKFQTYICKIFNVKSWKEKIPVGGHVAGFRLNKISSPRDINFLNRYLRESCFSDWLHSTLFFWSFFALLLLPNNLLFKMSLPIAFLFAYANIVPAMIQWYMRPRVLKLRNSIAARICQQLETDEEKHQEV